MRDVLAHDFQDLDIVMVWRAATYHVPVLAAAYHVPVLAAALASMLDRA
jgi:uncharacterized protein with HEPN domain